MKAKGTDLVVKDNALIEASYRLSLTEQRLILCAIVEARESQRGLRGDTFATITAKQFVAFFPDASLDSAYHMLKDACDSLMRRQVTFGGIDEATGNPCIDKVQWVSRARYVPRSALVRLRFSEEMAPLITRLEKEFTFYRLELVSKLTSVYAIRIYELLLQYRDIGKRSFDLADLKRILGLDPSEYSGRTGVSDFKKRVVDIAMKQINEHTDIRVDYQNIKDGRSVVGLLFTIKMKPEPKAPKVSAKPIKLPDSVTAPVVRSAKNQAVQDARAAALAAVRGGRGVS
jgi:plasmid replication initiation protein